MLPRLPSRVYRPMNFLAFLTLLFARTFGAIRRALLLPHFANQSVINFIPRPRSDLIQYLSVSLLGRLRFGHC